MDKVTERQAAVVGVFLYNSCGEVLLQQRDDKPGLRYPNHWTIFGGAVENGETPDEAIHRELDEELAIGAIQPLTYWSSYVCPVRTIPGQVTTTNYLYYGELVRDPAHLVLREGQGMAWFNAAAAEHLTLAFEQSPPLRRFFAERGRLW